jgi:hypothetical protein
MLDMFVSFIAFIVISIKGLLKYFVFRPPNPPGRKNILSYNNKVIV